jgi:hypothetical protein
MAKKPPVFKKKRGYFWALMSIASASVYGAHSKLGQKDEGPGDPEGDMH